MNNQCRRVLQYIDEHGSITNKEASDELGVGSLASRIIDIKASGVPIKKVMEKGVNRYGETTTFAKYSRGGEAVEMR